MISDFSISKFLTQLYMANVGILVPYRRGEISKPSVNANASSTLGSSCRTSQILTEFPGKKPHNGWKQFGISS